MRTDDYRVRAGHDVDLATFGTRAPEELDKPTAQARTAELTARLAELQHLLYADGTHKVLVVLQATDTGGKDGTIRNVFGPLDALGVRVAAFKAPTEIELAHDYLWRVHAHTPASGELVVFNRSHYEDVLVVRVHGLVPERRWKRRYEHISHFERMLVDEGTTIVKFFLHISKREQKERLQARLDDPTKNWKFNEGDLAEREKWADYQAAYTDMVNRTSADHAPWYVVPADNKWYRDLVVAQVMVDTLETLDLKYPPAEVDPATIVID